MDKLAQTRTAFYAQGWALVHFDHLSLSDSSGLLVRLRRFILFVVVALLLPLLLQSFDLLFICGILIYWLPSMFPGKKAERLHLCVCVRVCVVVL